MMADDAVLKHVQNLVDELLDEPAMVSHAIVTATVLTGHEGDDAENFLTLATNESGSWVLMGMLRQSTMWVEHVTSDNWTEENEL